MQIASNALQKALHPTHRRHAARYASKRLTNALPAAAPPPRASYFEIRQLLCVAGKPSEIPAAVRAWVGQDPATMQPAGSVTCAASHPASRLTHSSAPRPAGSTGRLSVRPRRPPQAQRVGQAPADKAEEEEVGLCYRCLPAASGVEAPAAPPLPLSCRHRRLTRRSPLAGAGHGGLLWQR